MMRNNLCQWLLLLFFFLSSCTKDIGGVAGSERLSLATDGAFAGTGIGNGNGNPGNQQAGVVTAGEWNDLDHWSFWDTLINRDNFKMMPATWGFYNNNRVSVEVVSNDALPVANALVKLKRNGGVVFTAKTDNKGKAELWPDLLDNKPTDNFTGFTIDVNDGTSILNNVKKYRDGINKIVTSATAPLDKVEIAFVVDATSSMGDELEFLKRELLDVINRIKNDNPNRSLSTSSIFYRDQGDEYVTRVSGFSNDILTTLNFVKNQSAGGGGDFPEAVHTALNKSVNELQWSANAKTRLLFLLLDAPPHEEQPVIKEVQASVVKAAEKGIRIIPITASGINKETELLMRFMAISTNGTYVFITNHSGIGNTHLEATVGPYQVEYLNNLMVRLVNEYAK